jgi:hypothetical protein
MAKDHQRGRHRKKSVLTSFSQLAEVQMNASLVKAKNYNNSGRTNVKVYTRQRLMG